MNCASKLAHSSVDNQQSTANSIHLFHSLSVCVCVRARMYVYFLHYKCFEVSKSFDNFQWACHSKIERKIWIWKRHTCAMERQIEKGIHILSVVFCGPLPFNVHRSVFCYLRVAALFTHAFLFMEKSTRILMYGCDYGCLGVCVCLCVLKVVAPLFCGVWDANVWVNISTYVCWMCVCVCWSDCSAPVRTNVRTHYMWRVRAVCVTVC